MLAASAIVAPQYVQPLDAIDGLRVDLVELGDGAQQASNVIYFHPDRIIVSFSRVANTDGAAGAHSVLNPANWQLYNGNVDVSHLISGIDFTAGNQAILSLSEKLDAGSYRLVALDSIYDTIGRALDGDGDLQTGGNFDGTFVVSSASTTLPDISVGRASSGDTPAIATYGDGKYIVAWIDNPRNTLDTSQSRILAQRFDSDGTAIGDVMVVDSGGWYGSGLNIAATADGEFVVSWRALFASIFDNIETGRLAQRFDGNGQAVGDQFTLADVYGTITSFQMTDSGGILVGYTHTDSRAIIGPGPPPSRDPQARIQQFDRDGHSVGPTISLGVGTNVQVALGPDGSFVALWTDARHPSSGVFVQRFGADGTPLFDPVLVGPAVGASNFALATNASGSFVAGWIQTNNGEHQVFVQRFDAEGRFLRGAQQVSDTPESVLSQPIAIAMDAAGNFFVRFSVYVSQPADLITPLDTINVTPWTTYSVSNSYIDRPGTIRIRAYDPSGNAIGGSFSVGSWLGQAGVESMLALDGQVTITWLDSPRTIDYSNLTLQNLLTVHLDRFAVPRTLGVDLNGEPPGIGYEGNFIPNGAPVPVGNPDRLVIFPAGATQLAGATIAIAGYLPGDMLSVDVAGTLITAAFTGGVLTLSGSDSIAHYEQVLRSATFQTAASRAAGTTVDVSVVISDGTNQSEAAVSKISIYVPGLASVAGRDIFYNNSAFDGNDSTANAADDAAIATDKTALLPGQTATFSNYTGYSGGINGVIVDLAGQHGTITTDDFIFRLGASSDTSHWSYAPDPLSVVVLAGAGVGGSDRVEIVWADGAIKNTWLQVIVLANGNTGLAQSDTFFFGNYVGDTGNEPDRARVSTSDLFRVVNQILRDPHGEMAQPIDYAADFNRDGRVTMADVIIVINQLLKQAPPLELISVDAGSAQSGAITAGLILTMTTGSWNTLDALLVVVPAWEPADQVIETPPPPTTPALLMDEPDGQ